ncbi:recombinase family protein [Ruminococcus sp.]|uniref:recombinase family protein n=1 Tax=Ruminococcus sp. TaxID=41978 RepID=UPI0026726825
MGNAASASYSVFSTIPGLSVARKTLIFQCFQKYRYLTSAFNRPGFQEMLALVKSRQVERILVKDLSRLGRNYIETGRFIDLEFPCLCQ